jgi:hypothetical protein
MSAVGDTVDLTGAPVAPAAIEASTGGRKFQGS